MEDTVPVGHATEACPRPVGTDRPWRWLEAGWRDFQAAPGISLTFGSLLAILGFAATFGLYFYGMLYLLLPLTATFSLVAPMLAVGLYETSRRLERYEQPSFVAALSAWRRNPAQIALLGVFLMMFHLAWVEIGMVLFALFFPGATPSLGAMAVLAVQPATLPLLVVGSLVGGALAALVLAASAVAIPMLLDRDVDVFTAIAASAATVHRNWRAMALWAALIASFTVCGALLFFLGLAVAMPLVAYASWHCYRDLVV